MATVPMERTNASMPGIPVFYGTWRWLAAIIVVTGPLLQAIEFLMEGEAGDSAAQVANWTANPERIGLGMASGFLAVPFLLGSIAVFVALTRSYSRRLAWLAGAFMTFGMAGLAAAHGYEIAAYGLVQAGNPTMAISVLDGDMLGLPGLVLLGTFFGGVVVGTITLAVVAWRSPLVPRLTVLCMIAFGVLDFAVGLGVLSHLVNLAGSLVLAGALVRGYVRKPKAAGQASMESQQA